ncbi:MAG TPA: tRNA (guanosine(37)-N1)-methyltransferase TrmD [Bacillota bacterium]|nr:tRNA (guanosine(37)-N1)-methyltransferase TrmD [Bacillota bacterium]HOK68980.1 tRNA (guanosine(37)-N1)-methyltransferase TrmD [Bacillota bacterium]HPP85379.1 tRNA (guanosine(37)-N1)-methyltransferase TrmD [Bacillota bacterium]
MRFEVLTLFPEMLEGFFKSSILGRAAAQGYIEINCTNIRDYTKNKHRKVDDTPYGGGYGMIMACQPVVDCIRAVKAKLPNGCDKEKTRVIYMSPQGKLFDQKKAHELKRYENLILLCGHYEGIDERIIELEVDEELSVGNYVLTGGELPAAIVVDAVSRLVDGVLPSPLCYEDESLQNGLLEHPQYTRPRVFEGLAVPEVLINGNHAMQEAWKKEQALKRTLEKRPDLLKDKT